MFPDDFEDSFLEPALTQAMEYRMGQIPREMEAPHAFSRRHRRRMKTVFREACRPPRVNKVIFLGKRMSAVLVAALVAAFGGVMLVEAWREAFFAFLQEKLPDHSIVSYVRTGETPLPETLVKYAPSYIPEGYSLTDSDETSLSQMLVYENDKDESIFFMQTRLDVADFAIDTETEDFEIIDLEGQPARFLSNEGEYMLIWENNQYSFLLRVNMNKDELIKIAKSTKMKK